MIMWRVQDKNGDGPYNHETQSTWREQDHSLETGRPIPEHDLKLAQQLKDQFGSMYVPSEYIFGFKTLKQYKAWFDKGERKRLKELGYKLVKMNVDNMIWSDYQAITFQTKGV